MGNVARFMQVWTAAMVCLLAACAPPTPEGSSSQAPSSGRQAQPASAPRATGPKTLTIALQREYDTAIEGEGQYLLRDGLVLNRSGEVDPLIATELPSVEKGTWRINDDGTMETTWKIHPNVKWHDGTPFTSEDLLFSFTARKNNSLLAEGSASTLRTMSSATAPDPHTFVVRWSQVNVRAPEAVGLEPLPKHLLETAYNSLAPETLVAQPYFRTEYIGLGPYKLVAWNQGVDMQLARFDEYYRGPAKIDRIILRFVPDPQVMVATIMSSSVDVVLPPGVELEAAATLKRQWEGTGNQVAIGGGQDINSGYTLQFRPEYARPLAGLPNRDVREALFRAIDRVAMTEVLTNGLAPVADSWISPTHQMRSQVESAIPHYPYDLNRAQQLLAQAGWTSRGPDGILVHAQTGERFSLELAGPARAALQRQQAIIADGWKQIGVEGEQYVVPSALDLIPETRSVRPGIYLGSIAAERYLFQDQLHSREITSAANWNLRNRGGYSSPVVDSLYDQLRVTIDERQRVPLQRELVRTAMTDVAWWPFFWDVYPVLAVSSVKARIDPSKGGTLHNILEWDKT